MDLFHAGIRTSKTVNGVVYNYYYDGSQLVRMTYGDNVLDFSYDINGVPVAMRHGYASHNNYVVYYYITNLQGDVVRLVDIYGNTAAYYEYDAFGNVLEASGSHANVNPLRYRGYVYDTDTGLYYLQSRYYDPQTGRFINADSYASTGQGILGNNMFAYCNNNPVNYSDPTGHLGRWCLATIKGALLKVSRALREICTSLDNLPYITNQSAIGIGDRKLGIASVDHGGCGAVATYNALMSLGSEKSFDDVLAYYNEGSNKLVGWGLGGILPETVANYFRKAGYTVVVTDDIDEIDYLSKHADASILWYMFPATYTPSGLNIDAFGAHFVEYSRAPSGYIGRNTAEGNGVYAFRYPSDYAYKGSRYYAVGIFIYE